ncbi:MAG: zinc dependent phospholipase C family protein [Dehalococcoidia bacterium]
MPPLGMHLTFARDAFPHLEDGLKGCRGYYLFGATLPDMHLIAGFARQHTHYVELGQEEGGQEIDRFFRANPHLARSRNHRPTRALAAGYLSHLVMDGTWIARIYRPYFGPDSSLSGDPLANLLDRLLQYELDRREREELGGMAALVRDIGLVSWDEEAPLFEEDSLMRWQTFVMDAAVRPHTWDRFPVFIRHYASQRPDLTEAQVEQFLSDRPRRLAWVLDHVLPEALDTFRHEALQESLRVARERLW